MRGKKSRQGEANATQSNASNRGSIAAAEAQDLSDLREIASSARVVEFDEGGRVTRPSFLPADAFDAIQGLVKITVPTSILSSLAELHGHIKSAVGKSKMAPWAGSGEDTCRLRAFGVLGDTSLARLDDSAVRLHAPEKVGDDADRDEAANRAALTVLRGPWKTKGEDAARELVDIIRPNEAGLPVETLRAENLVAYQPNLHNGAAHLAAHLDWPLHEGFGKVIVTVAMRGGATILLIGEEDDGKDQPSWRFHLNEGECYVLSGWARSRCLHAVLADDDTGRRESLNLRFGLHTDKEAVSDVTQYWADSL